MRAVDIFTPGKAPTVTFVGDHLAKREGMLRDALEQGGMLISISGPSKSGKTVFIRSVLGAECVVFVTGAGVTSPDQLWERVFHAIGTPVTSTSSTSSQASSKVGATGQVSGSVLVAKGQIGVNVEKASSDTESVSNTEASSHLGLLVREMAGTGMVLFIDDFHYVPRELQEELARQIKDAIASGVQIICASVPYRSEDVLRANPDLRGRVVGIDFDYWDEPTLRKIGALGFAALKVEADPVLIAKFASEAAGSPQLMQALCLNACLETGFREVQKNLASLPFEEGVARTVCGRTAHSADYSGTLERLHEGPKTRGTERNQYRLTDRSVGDVYTILLQALAQDPPTLHFQYADLLARIKVVCESDTPPGSSVTTSCQHIALLANDGQARDIVGWDATQDVFDIRDPYLLFFMRWGGMS
ncbi:AAA family ATPase [Luteibacter sp.]|jgi:hypothetical protein|uniref:AAA family ATPase n=1 Tax=Luteibacter sp. TaxID=1886636 RepID=UPI002F3EE78A